jgi:hypothetical protein
MKFPSEEASNLPEIPDTCIYNNLFSATVKIKVNDFKVLSRYLSGRIAEYHNYSRHSSFLNTKQLHPLYRNSRAPGHVFEFYSSRACILFCPNVYY